MADAKIDTVEIERRLAVIRDVFSTDSLASRGEDQSDIAQYYQQSSLGYRMVHSKSGAMHMALNPSGVFEEAGYLGQANAVEALIAPSARRVLELASGKGFNCNYLAARHPAVEFVGADLVPGQARQARKRAGRTPNVRFLAADFQSLPFPADTFDTVFVVESLCHALDMTRALDEAARTLSPGGVFVVIDAWRTPTFDGCPEVVKGAAALTERAMAVADAWRLDEWLSLVERAGFTLLEDRDLTGSIMPNLRRLEGIADRYFRRPALARFGARLMPIRLVQNSIAGYLMPLTVGAGAHTYHLVALRKK